MMNPSKLLLTLCILCIATISQAAPIGGNGGKNSRSDIYVALLNPAQPDTNQRYPACEISRGLGNAYAEFNRKNNEFTIKLGWDSTPTVNAIELGGPDGGRTIVPGGVSNPLLTRNFVLSSGLVNDMKRGKLAIYLKTNRCNAGELVGQFVKVFTG